MSIKTNKFIKNFFFQFSDKSLVYWFFVVVITVIITDVLNVIGVKLKNIYLLIPFLMTAIMRLGACFYVAYLVWIHFIETTWNRKYYDHTTSYLIIAGLGSYCFVIILLILLNVILMVQFRRTREDSIVMVHKYESVQTIPAEN